MNKYLKYYFISIFILNGCSPQPTDYSKLIHEYEETMAANQAEEIVGMVSDLHIQHIENTTIPSFMSQPIPAHYKKHHQSLGLDINKLNYTQEEWLLDIQEDDQRVVSHEDNGHAH